MIIFSPVSFSLPVSLKGLIVFIAEAAAPLAGALKECIEELHNKTSLLCTAIHIYCEGHASTLNRTSGKVSRLQPGVF